jgi:hypothetical protein
MSETRIDANQAGSWAQEITLKRLYDEARDQTGLLEKLAGTRAADLRVARDAAEGLTDVADAAEDITDALDDATRAARRAAREAQSRSREEAERARESDRLQRELQYERERREYSYRQSLNDLRTNLNAVSTATPASLWTSLGDRMAVLGGAMSETGGKSRLLGGSLTALSRVVAVATVAFAYYRDGFQTLTNMTEAGVLFNGSVEQMRQSVGRTGLSLQDFSRMVNQFGQVIGGVGEQSYARNIRQVQDLTRQFGRYGQSFEQQAESVTVFFDMLRSGGQIFMMTEQQRSRAAADYIAQTTALTRLTGRQRRQIEQEQSQVMMQAEVDLAIREMRARGDTQGAETMQQMVRTLTATLGPEMGLGVAAMQMGIVPRNQDLRRLMYTTGMGESVQGMVGQMRTMTPAQMTQQSEAIFRRMSEDPQLLGMLRVGATAGGSMEGAARLMSRMFQERGDRLIQAERTGEMPAMLEVMAGTRGILNEAATGFAQVTGDVQRAMGDLRATVASLTEQFNVFGLAFPALANITGGAMGITNMIYGMSQSLSGAALLAGGGLGAVLGARALGRGASGLVRGLGAPPAVPGMASSAGAARPGMGPMRGGLAGVAGMGAGYLAGSMGAPTWASGALTGAGTGAMIGSIIPGIGTGIGAALGAALGGAYGYFGQEGTATAVAGGTQMPDMTASMNRLNTTMSQGLGPDGSVVRALMDLKSAIENSERAVVTAIRQQ